MYVNDIHLQTVLKLVEQSAMYGKFIQRAPSVTEISVMGQYFIIETAPTGLMKIDGHWKNHSSDNLSWAVHGDDWSMKLKTKYIGPYRNFDSSARTAWWEPLEWTENHYRWGKEGVHEYVAHEFFGNKEDFQKNMFFIKMIEDQEFWEEFLY